MPLLYLFLLSEKSKAHQYVNSSHWPELTCMITFVCDTGKGNVSGLFYHGSWERETRSWNDYWIIQLTMCFWLRCAHWISPLVCQAPQNQHTQLSTHHLLPPSKPSPSPHQALGSPTPFFPSPLDLIDLQVLFHLLCMSQISSLSSILPILFKKPSSPPCTDTIASTSSSFQPTLLTVPRIIAPKCKLAHVAVVL